MRNSNEQTFLTEDGRNTATLILSDLLNDAKIFDRFAEATGFQVDNNSMIFHDIEEFIVDKFEEMQEEINK